jgi:hypothetical protein
VRRRRGEPGLRELDELYESQRAALTESEAALERARTAQAAALSETAEALGLGDATEQASLGAGKAEAGERRFAGQTVSILVAAEGDEKGVQDKKLGPDDFAREFGAEFTAGGLASSTRRRSAPAWPTGGRRYRLTGTTGFSGSTPRSRPTRRRSPSSDIRRSTPGT